MSELEEINWSIAGNDRYRVERHRGGWLRNWRVMCGNGHAPVFVGTYKQCLRVEAELVRAFNDGRYMAERAFVEIQLITDPNADKK